MDEYETRADGKLTERVSPRSYSVRVRPRLPLDDSRNTRRPGGLTCGQPLGEGRGLAGVPASDVTESCRTQDGPGVVVTLALSAGGEDRGGVTAHAMRVVANTTATSRTHPNYNACEGRVPRVTTYT